MVAHGACNLSQPVRAFRKALVSVLQESATTGSSVVTGLSGRGPAAGLNCTQLLDVGSWQNATSPEEMAAIANPPSQGWSESMLPKTWEHTKSAACQRHHPDCPVMQKRSGTSARGQGKALAGSGSLTSLDLCACGITADGAAHMAEGVGKSEFLVTLTLHDNKIEDGGAGWTRHWRSAARSPLYCASCKWSSAREMLPSETRMPRSHPCAGWRMAWM